MPTWRRGSDLSDVEQIATEFATARVRIVRIGGHGEMTMIPGWPAICHTFTRLTSTELNLFEGFSTLGWLRWVD
jgi:hypothetical protein